MKIATARDAQELALKKSVEKQENLCKLSGALAVLASASVSLDLFTSCSCRRCFAKMYLFVCMLSLQSVSKERAEFLRLVNKEVRPMNYCFFRLI
jgi:LETM1 and EF-hand domain-containing protein 1